MFIKKGNFSLNKKVIFVFHTIFKLNFIMQIIYCFINPDDCILFPYFFCSLTSVSKKQNTETMLILAPSYNWRKFNDKINEKKKPGV